MLQMSSIQRWLPCVAVIGLAVGELDLPGGLVLSSVSTVRATPDPDPECEPECDENDCEVCVDETCESTCSNCEQCCDGVCCNGTFGLCCNGVCCDDGDVNTSDFCLEGECCHTPRNLLCGWWFDDSKFCKLDNCEGNCAGGCSGNVIFHYPIDAWYCIGSCPEQTWQCKRGEEDHVISTHLYYECECNTTTGECERGDLYLSGDVTEKECRCFLPD